MDITYLGDAARELILPVEWSVSDRAPVKVGKASAQILFVGLTRDRGNEKTWKIALRWNE